METNLQQRHEQPQTDPWAHAPTNWHQDQRHRPVDRAHGLCQAAPEPVLSRRDVQLPDLGTQRQHQFTGHVWKDAAHDGLPQSEPRSSQGAFAAKWFVGRPSFARGRDRTNESVLGSHNGSVSALPHCQRAGRDRRGKCKQAEWVEPMELFEIRADVQPRSQCHSISFWKT